MSRCSKHGTNWNTECDECEGKAPESARGSFAAPPCSVDTSNFSKSGADYEMFRALVKPLVLEMHKRGLNQFTIWKTGTHVDITAR